MKRGLILNNIGTPEAPRKKEVKAYLDEFLMDKNVIGAPWPIRYLFVKGLITPRRSEKSAEKYAQVWMSEGSPLMVHTRNFAREVERKLGPEWSVKIGMRYGKPSIRQALEELRKVGVEELYFAPMYPQNAQSSTTSSVEELMGNLEDMNWGLPLQILKPFHADDGFLNAKAQLLKPLVKGNEHVLFSFHGLPESHIKKTPGCVRPGCCERPQACALGCYKAQSLKTAKDLAAKLGLSADRWSVSFQSRLGPTKWIQPSTDDTLKALAHDKKNVLVVCPSFVADCLETLEEIGIGAKRDYATNGGGEFRLAPCLNDNSEWAEAFTKLLKTET